jgi:hypothetical protein
MRAISAVFFSLAPSFAAAIEAVCKNHRNPPTHEITAILALHQGLRRVTNVTRLPIGEILM